MFDQTGEAETQAGTYGNMAYTKLAVDGIDSSKELVERRNDGHCTRRATCRKE